jgi:hypothetical protein
MNTSRIYLAARYSRRAELLEHADDLYAAGVGLVRARWLYEDHDWPGDAASPEGIAAAAHFAVDDYEDIRAADLVIVFSEQPAPGGRNRGGRHVELGLALAWRKPLVVVGPPENVFMMLPGLCRVTNWRQALLMLESTRGLTSRPADWSHLVVDP